MLMIQNQLGVPLAGNKRDDVLGVLKPLKWFKWFKPLQDLVWGAKDVTSKPTAITKGADPKGGFWRYSMYPMKPYDLFQNGNGFGQVWAIINGKASLTTGAQTGVDVASWGAGKLLADTSGDSVDFAEAEFYYDCGPHSGPEAPGRDDSGGVWTECKYNAMWNMKWKARLRRYHPFEFNALKAAELALYNGIGGEGVIQNLLKFTKVLDPFGVGEKYTLIDAIKSCFTGIGQGKSGWTHGPEAGACPLPMGGPKGFGDVTFGLGSDAPGVSDYNTVLH
jgi:hypothetical protein